MIDRLCEPFLFVLVIWKNRFWPDSRDFFDENGILPLLTDINLRKTFPIHAWWVRQGFDTALVLIDRVKSATILRTLHYVASDPKYQFVRSLSMVSLVAIR